MKLSHQKGQTAIEYMLLLAAVVAIVLLALPNYIPRVNNAANLYYAKAANTILGEPPRCGDGLCGPFENNERCCDDCLPGC